MDDASVSFDTLGVGHDGRPTGPPVLARLPRVETAPARIHRADKRPEPIHEPHAPAPASTPVATLGDPTATVRFDTVPTSAGYVPAELYAYAVTDREPPTPAEPVNWLLRLEAALVPYERWVALAAVIAALGLTLSLLSGKPEAPTVETPSEAVFAGDAGPTYEPAIDRSEPIDQFGTALATPAEQAVAKAVTATGPRGLPIGEGPRARLAGRVALVPAGSFDAYPRTAVAPSAATDSVEGSVRR